MFCLKCGAELPEGVRFCVKCGAKVAEPHDAGAQPGAVPGVQQPAAGQPAAGRSVTGQSAAAFADAPIVTAPTAAGQPAAGQPAAAASAAAAGQPAAPSAKKRGVVIAVAIVAVAACIAVGAVLWLNFGQGAGVPAAQGSQQAAESSGSAASDADASGESSDSSAAAATKTWSYKWFRFTLPESAADRITFTESASGECEMVDLEVDGVRVATLETMRPKAAGGGNEQKFDTYELGTATSGSESVGVRALVYYKSSRGDGTTHWGDSAATELLCMSKLGMAPEELLGCIDLCDKDGWAKAKPSLTSSATGSAGGSAASSSGASSGQGSASAASSSGSADSQAAFWGIWIGASKSEDEARSFASEASGKGLDASVTITTDWENLNSEPWYVITAGRYASEADANAKLDSVKSAGYGDAYVKYSGAHR